MPSPAINRNVNRLQTPPPPKTISPYNKGKAGKGKLDVYGLDNICMDIMGGESMLSIANRVGVTLGMVINWVSTKPERLDRVNAARMHAAVLWDELAERRLAEAENKLETSKATALAHHYRWRAGVVAPKMYGNKVTSEISGPGGSPLQISSLDLKGLTDEELAIVERLMLKAAKSNSDKAATKGQDNAAEDDQDDNA